MRPDRYFFCPQPTPQTTNKYISNFYEKLSERVKVVNYNKKRMSMAADLLRYSTHCDVMVLNWPEEAMHWRFGIIQTLISMIILTIFRIGGGTIVWVCHNKDSHTKRLRLLRKITRYFFIKVSQYIIVHSEDAVEHFKKERQKVYFLSHPVYNELNIKNINNDGVIIDVLIWGSIIPYKGLTEFIENYIKNNATFHVTIIGKANKEYYKQLIELADGLNVSIEDRYITDNELELYFKKSKIILLPYLESDTFSSGALVHSLNSSKIIIGPSVGNFIDLWKGGACLIYKDYKDLFQIINRCLMDQQYYHSKLKEAQTGIQAYRDSNSWEAFIENLLNLIDRRKGRLYYNEKKELEKSQNDLPKQVQQGV